MQRSAFILLAGVLFGAMAETSPSAAQSLEVSPVVLEIAAGKRAAVLNLSNTQTAELTFQLRGYSWRQPLDGADVQAVADAVVISPPFVTLAPGASQIVRVMLPASAKTTTSEIAYRVHMDQVPPPPKPGQVQMVLHMSLPLFGGVDVAQKPAVVWRLHADAAGGGWLTAQNTGGRHEHVGRLALSTSTGAKVAVSPNGSDYILAGASRRWKIPPSPGLKVGSPLSLVLDGVPAGVVDPTADGG